MTRKDFYAQLKTGAVQSVYLFTGQEEYLKREAVNALSRALLPEGLEQINLSVLEGVNAMQIIDAVETLPLMCERRVVIVRDWAPLLGGKARGEEDDASRMLEWLKAPPASCVVVFLMREDTDGRKKLTTALRKRGAEVRFDLLTDAELFRWASARIKPLGKIISQQAVSHLAFMAGRELTRLCGEVDKLADYVGSREEICAEDIDAVVSPSPEFSVFEMLDFLFAGDLVHAERSMKTLLMSGQSYVGLLAMIIRQLHTLAHLSAAMRAGESTAAVEKALKLHPYAAKRAAQQARALDAGDVARLYEQCVRADFDIKSGKLHDREALQLAMLKIAGLRAKRGTESAR